MNNNKRYMLMNINRGGGGTNGNHTAMSVFVIYISCCKRQANPDWDGERKLRKVGVSSRRGSRAMDSAFFYLFPRGKFDGSV